MKKAKREKTQFFFQKNFPKKSKSEGLNDVGFYRTQKSLRKNIFFWETKHHKFTNSL